jgi:hypothetical protein
MVELSLERRMREADVGSQSADTIKLGFSSCSNLWKRRQAEFPRRGIVKSANQEGGGGRLPPNTVRHRSPHAAQAIRKLAVVILVVPEVNDC